jgi:hypothetical protein
MIFFKYNLRGEGRGGEGGNILKNETHFYMHFNF